MKAEQLSNLYRLNESYGDDLYPFVFVCFKLKEDHLVTGKQVFKHKMFTKLLNKIKIIVY